MLTIDADPNRQTRPEAGVVNGTTAMTCPQCRVRRGLVSALAAIAFALPPSLAGVALVVGPSADVEVAVTDGTSNT